MAEEAVKGKRLNIRQACEAFSISQTYYRYEPKLSCENALIADWLVRLTNYQHLFENIEEVQDYVTKWLWTCNNERPNMGWHHTEAY